MGLLSRELHVFSFNHSINDLQVIGPLTDFVGVIKGLFNSLEYPGTYDTDAEDVKIGVCDKSQLHECSRNPRQFLLPHTAFSYDRPAGFIEVVDQLKSLRLAQYADSSNKELLKLLTRIDTPVLGSHVPTIAYVVDYPDGKQQVSTILVCRGRDARGICHCNPYYWFCFKLEYDNWLHWARYEGATDLTLCPSFPSRERLAKWLFRTLEKRVDTPYLLKVCRTIR